MSLGTIKDYTPNFNLIIPEFNISGWHDYLEENFRSIDALFYNLFGINNYNGMWMKLTSYTAGQVVFIGDDTNYSGRLVKVLVNHTTTNDDFTTFFTNNPTYYELFADASTAQYYAIQAKDWATKMNGPVEGSNYSAKYYADLVDNLSTEITTLYNIANDIQTVANISTDVENVADNGTNIATVASMQTDINDVVAIKSDIEWIADNDTIVTNVSNNSTKITTVANNISSVNTTATNITDINTVSSISSNVTSVAGNATNINSVASNSANITAVAQDLTNINTVASNQTNINTTATNISAINTNASNITAIQNASTNATNAQNSANAAANSAEQAAISAAGTHFKLFQHNWFDYLLNDMAWLRSDTFSWQDGTVYETAYQHLVDDLDIRETQVITFGNPKVNPETSSTEYVATRSPENDVISSGLYAWYDADYETLYYTQSENPAVNDRLYTVNSDPYGYVVWTITTEDMPSVLPTIETVGSYSIVVYIAEDGHKIVLSDQAQMVENIYDESGVAWYFILDTENQRFKLPRTKFGFTGLRDTVGKYVPAGLPNITGQVGTSDNASYLPNGAFYASDSSGHGNGSGGSITVSMNASLSNSIYGNSTTVQPPATQMYLYFYVGQFSQSATEQTAGLNSELFNNKLDLDLGNLTNASKETIAELSMPSDTWIDLSVPAQLTPLTAPANGYYCARSSGQLYISICNPLSSTTENEVMSSWLPINGSALYLPVKKGQQVKLGYSAALQYFRFVYAEGEI